MEDDALALALTDGVLAWLSDQNDAVVATAERLAWGSYTYVPVGVHFNHISSNGVCVLCLRYIGSESAGTSRIVVNNLSNKCF